MSEWRRIKLSQCCKSIADGDHQPPPKAESGIPFVTISNITSTNQFDFSDTLYVPQDYYDGLDDKRRAKKNDILYSVVGSFGIPVFMKEDKAFVFQRHIAILRPDEDEIVPRFLYYTMLTRDFYAKADAAALGAAQRTVSLTSLRNMEIDIPKKDQQERIVEILSSYDDLIENNQKQIKLLEEAAQRLYKEWFVDMHFPGYEDVQFVDGVPEGWDFAPIDSKISLLSGYAFKSSTFSNNGKYKIVTIKNVKDGEFDGNNVSLIEEIPSKMPAHCILSEGDILLSLTGNVGRVCMVYGEDFLLNQRVAKLQSETPGYTYCLFRSKDIINENVEIEQPEEGLVESRQFDISQIDFDLLAAEFAQVKRKNLLIKDLNDLVQERLSKMMSVNPSRVDYYVRYMGIIEVYNAEQDRTTIEKTFMELMDLAKSMSEEEQRFAREGFSNDEELSIYDLLFSDNLSKSDIDKIKKMSVDLLKKIKERIASMDHWTDKQETRAAVDVLIRNVLYEQIPDSMFDRLEAYRKAIYEHIYTHYKEAA